MSTSIDTPNPTLAPPGKHGGRRPNQTGRPPSAEPAFIVQLSKTAIKDVRGQWVTLFLFEALDTEGHPKLRRITATLLRILPHDLARAVRAAEAKASAQQADQLQEAT
jgi:hypothetical protein